MKFYHGTTLENWKLIQKEGILFGVRPSVTLKDGVVLNPSRCTYLAKTSAEARKYGEIILEVEYNPLEHPDQNNYFEDVWQCRVYEPIPLSNVKVITPPIIPMIRKRWRTLANELIEDIKNEPYLIKMKPVELPFKMRYRYTKD